MASFFGAIFLFRIHIKLVHGIFATFNINKSVNNCGELKKILALCFNWKTNSTNPVHFLAVPGFRISSIDKNNGTTLYFKNKSN